MKVKAPDQIAGTRMVASADNKGPVRFKGLFMWRISPPLLLVLVAAEVAGLRDVQVIIPEAAAVNDTVTLKCNYDLETETLYSVKWFRGRNEFYRYIPKELPHIKVFPLDGMEIDVGRSGPTSVVLRAVIPSLSGKYRCEVLADSPSFHTAMKSGFMYVVELPETVPYIQSEKHKVSVGDILKVRCMAPATYPPANITWSINDKIVPGTPISWAQNDTIPMRRDGEQKDSSKEFIRDEKFNVETNSQTFDRNKRQKEEHSESWNNSTNDKQPGRFYYPNSQTIPKAMSRSILEFPIKQDLFLQGQLKISCKASVFSLYKAEAKLFLDEDRPQIALILGKTETPTNGAVSIRIRLTSLIISYILFKL